MEKNMDLKVYVGNLPYHITEDNLRDLFSQAGEVASVALIKDRDTGQSKGFAFIEMGSQVDAEKAISMFNDYSVDDRQLKVNIARPREERGSSGGYKSDRNKRGGGKRPRRY
jgi:RNA recognition motif-containing protein